MRVRVYILQLPCHDNLLCVSEFRLSLCFTYVNNQSVGSAAAAQATMWWTTGSFRSKVILYIVNTTPGVPKVGMTGRRERELRERRDNDKTHKAVVFRVGVRLKRSVECCLVF